jgi:hypothetical protein
VHLTRTGRIATPATKIGNAMRCTARSGFDAGRFKGMPMRDRRYPVVDTQTCAVMRLVRCGDPTGTLSKASMPSHALVGASFVSEIFSAIFRSHN